MGFRDDREALRERVVLLERELEELRRENAALRAPAAGAVLDLAGGGRLALVLVALGELLAGLRGALAARGERIWAEDLYTYARFGYEGFYATPREGGARLFLAMHPGASLRLGVGPFVAQLTQGSFSAAALDAVRRRRAVRDQRELGWTEGPFVALELEVGLPAAGQIAHLVAQIDEIRGLAAAR